VGNNLTIASPQASSLIKTYPLEDFPSIPRVTESNSFSIPTADLFVGFKSVLYAASISDIKPEIASVYVYTENKTLLFVATDSFRLAEKQVLLQEEIPQAFKAIIPLKNAIELARVLEEADNTVQIDYDPHQLSITGESFYLTSRLVDGVFPDYRQIMPKSSSTEVVLSKEDFVSALRLANIFSDRLNRINFKVIPQENFVEISAQNTDVGENTIKLSPQMVQGEEIEINYNVKYILDCLSFITSQDISLKFMGKNRPMLLSPVGDNSFNYLVMPLNR
jgi:DNA polymerase-3 subunit beta